MFVYSVCIWTGICIVHRNTYKTVRMYVYGSSSTQNLKPLHYKCHCVGSSYPISYDSVSIMITCWESSRVKSWQRGTNVIMAEWEGRATWEQGMKSALSFYVGHIRGAFVVGLFSQFTILEHRRLVCKVGESVRVWGWMKKHWMPIQWAICYVILGYVVTLFNGTLSLFQRSNDYIM